MNDRELRNHDRTFLDYGYTSADKNLTMVIKKEPTEFPILLLALNTDQVR